MIKLVKRLLKVRIINFMLVGSIGGVVSLAIYYPLTLILQNNVAFLGQQFYLPATLVSTPSAITLNYWLNRKYTYRDCKAKQFSYGRYLGMGLLTAIGDVFVLFLLVQFGHIFYLLAAVLATLLMFLSRYFISNAWIWRTKLVVNENEG